MTAKEPTIFDQSLSTDLEWVQTGLDAIAALPPQERARVADDERYLRNLTRALESNLGNEANHDSL